MMLGKGGLGRGLSSLIPSSSPSAEAAGDAKRPVATGREIAEILIEDIVPNPHQPRESFHHDEMEDLIASIKEHGILQPLILSPKDDKYELIAGERRWRAAKMAGLRTVPAVVRTVKDQQKLEFALIENIQRQDLNPMEEAKAYKRLIDEFSLTQEEVAKRVGKSRPQVANFVRLLDLPLEIQEAVASGEMPYTQARTLLALDSPRAQLKLFKKIIRDKMTVRDTEKRVGMGRVSAEAASDPNLAAKEDALRTALGTKVEIKKRRDGGQIIIEYYSDEEFNNLILRLTE
ncbi:MAG: ParB/RepB/Spo0J family partition protein [Patescibacteria group bacterium]|nr:ParB/RepB/Spo0J family partition protein [Patescibacteria group bacterium]